MIECDVVMLSLTNSDHLYNMTVKALRSLRESDPTIKFNIILMESSPEWYETRWSYKEFADKVIKTPPPFNYNGSCKMGMSYGESKWVVLCNNDLLFYLNWFSNILLAHKERPDIKSFCPWNSYGQWHERIIGFGDNNIIEGYRTSCEMAGWCIVAKREIFNRVKLDDRVSFWYSDNVYADELMKYGIKHALVRKSQVEHLCSMTSSTLTHWEQLDLTRGQEKKYLEKMI